MTQEQLAEARIHPNYVGDLERGSGT